MPSDMIGTFGRKANGMQKCTSAGEGESSPRRSSRHGRDGDGEEGREQRRGRRPEVQRQVRKGDEVVRHPQHELELRGRG